MALLSGHRTDCYCWGIWKADKFLEEPLALLPGPEKYEQQLKRFSSPHRRLEWFSVHVLLYRLLGEEKSIEYAPNSKPRLADSSFFVSVSHTREYVAVILSAVSEVDIDIEQCGQRIHKVIHKYMREDETIFVYQGGGTWSLLLHWPTKEVMFKYMDADEVDFRKHLRIVPLQVCERGEFFAEEYRAERRMKFHIRYLLHPDFVMIWQMGSSFGKK